MKACLYKSALTACAALPLTLAVWATLMPVSASATVYNYSYMGQPFTSVQTPFTTSDAISFQFQSIGQLGDNWNDMSFVAPISAWSLSIGPLSISNSTDTLYSINFSTNAMGQITGYQFTTQTNTILNPPSGVTLAPYAEEVFSFDLPAMFGVADGIYIPSIEADSYYSYNENMAGTWYLDGQIISATPLPAALPLFATGLGGLGLLGWRRKRKVAAALAV